MLRRSLVRLAADPTAIVSMLLLLIVSGAALLAPWIAGSPTHVDPAIQFQPPSRTHPFGTDQLGRDIYAVVVYGGRPALGISALVTLLSVAIGAILGILAGYYSRADMILMRIVDGLMAFPMLVLLIGLLGVLGPGVSTLVLGLTIVLIPPAARVVRSATLVVKESAMVEAARSLGAGDFWILIRYIAPAALSAMTVQSTLSFASSVLAIAALSFLGIGLDPNTPSWGRTLADSQRYFAYAWWTAAFAGIAIVIAVGSVMALGDALRDALDVKVG